MDWRSRQLSPELSLDRGGDCGRRGAAKPLTEDRVQLLQGPASPDCQRAFLPESLLGLKGHVWSRANRCLIGNLYGQVTETSCLHHAWPRTREKPLQGQRFSIRSKITRRT